MYPVGMFLVFQTLHHIQIPPVSHRASEIQHYQPRPDCQWLPLLSLPLILRMQVRTWVVCNKLLLLLHQTLRLPLQVRQAHTKPRGNILCSGPKPCCGNSRCASYKWKMCRCPKINGTPFNDHFCTTSKQYQTRTDLHLHLHLHQRRSPHPSDVEEEKKNSLLRNNSL